MPTSSRPGIIPRWLVWLAAALVVLAVASLAMVFGARRDALVPVPNVTGLDIAVARSRLAEQGLLLKPGDQRFSSTVAAGGVIEQRPDSGTRVKKGSYVVVVVSAGSEAFAMPDVTGMPLVLARGLLQEKGLQVETEVVASDRPKNTVVSSLPGPGATVSTADVVKLSISSGGRGIDALRPADLTGDVFIIDPTPVSQAATDTTMEVQRRLNSLLGASGAKVYVTRTITDTRTTPAQRAERARMASATAVIGLDVATSGPGGVSFATMQPTKVPSAAYLGSVQIAQALLPALGKITPGIRSSEVASDPVLAAVGCPGVRVTLGSLSQAHDKADFADPAWADDIARAIYSALARVYGSKQ